MWYSRLWQTILDVYKLQEWGLGISVTPLKLSAEYSNYKRLNQSIKFYLTIFLVRVSVKGDLTVIRQLVFRASWCCRWETMIVIKAESINLSVAGYKYDTVLTLVRNLRLINRSSRKLTNRFSPSFLVHVCQIIQSFSNTCSIVQCLKPDWTWTCTTVTITGFTSKGIRIYWYVFPWSIESIF